MLPDILSDSKFLFVCLIASLLYYFHSRDKKQKVVAAITPHIQKPKSFETYFKFIANLAFESNTTEQKIEVDALIKVFKELYKDNPETVFTCQILSGLNKRNKKAFISQFQSLN